MKKVIIFLFFMTVILLCNSEEEALLIPDESLRFRIVANSNTIQDQKLKMDVRASLMPIFKNISNNSLSLEETKLNIKNNLDLIENAVSKHTSSYTINLGNNYFPEKMYNEVKYEAGEYESLVITLGEGIGENWWCVLFPPLCLLEAEASNLDEVTYASYFKKIIKKYS